MRLDGRIDAARIGAAGAAEGTTLVWRNGRFVAEATSGGGGVLGAAEITVTFPSVTSVTSNTFTAATGSSITYTYGTPGITESSGTLTYCNDSVPSLYVAHGVLAIAPPSVYAVTDLHQVELFDLTVSGMATFFHATSSSVAYPSPGGGGVAADREITAPSSGAVEVRIESTAGAGRVFSSVTAYLYVTRFALA